MSVKVPSDLIKSVKSGDRLSFGKLIDLCSQYVYAVSLKMIGDVDDAHDAAQDTFIKVWDKIDSYNFSFKFSTWLYKIAVNTCLDKLRKRTKYRAIFQQLKPDTHQYESYFSRPAVEFEENQMIDFIKIIAGKLSAKQHAVFVLHDLEECAQDEISSILGMSKGRVKSNLYHARKAVRQSLRLFDEKKMSTNYEV
jgi:RNA polymerase sigma-70 factor (ECF subfamily)